MFTTQLPRILEQRQARWSGNRRNSTKLTRSPYYVETPKTHINKIRSSFVHIILTHLIKTEFASFSKKISSSKRHNSKNTVSHSRSKFREYR